MINGIAIDAVARRNLYLSEIAATETYTDLTLAIERFRSEHQDTIKPWKSLPM